MANKGARISLHDMLAGYQDWFQSWYGSLGFSFTVPMPDWKGNLRGSDDLISPQRLFYLPSTREMSIRNFLRSIGRGGLWLTEATEIGVVSGTFATVSFEVTDKGYWFFGEAVMSCPRRGITWYKLNRDTKLPSIEEYMILWHAVHTYFTARGVGSIAASLDQDQFCLTRTKAGTGVLAVGAHGGEVAVSGPYTKLDVPRDDVGGRAIERV